MTDNKLVPDFRTNPVARAELVQTISEDADLMFSDESPEVLKAVKMLMLLDKKYSYGECAEFFGIERMTMWRWRKDWEANGALVRAREIYLLPLRDELVSSNRQLLIEYPKMIERIKRIVLHSRSDKTSLEAFVYINEFIIKPMAEAIPETGSAEAAYASKPADLTPTIIQMPKKLRRQVDGDD